MNPLACRTRRPLAATLLVLLSAATPAYALRELSTDRPDRTESPYSVDRGHVQVEVDAVSWTRDRQGSLESRSLGVLNTNFKYGVLANADLQLLIGAWSRDVFEESVGPAGGPFSTVESRDSGIGDLTLRWKQNLLGNDGGPVAIAVMPFVQAPLEGYEFDRMEAGLIVPVAFQGPAGFGFGVMGELDIRRDSFEGGHHAEYIVSATAARDLFAALGAYVEIFSLSRADAGVPWSGTFDVGLTCGIGDNLQLDAGANFGLSDNTEDVTVFFGFSARR